MSDTMNLNVRIRGALRDFVAEAVSDGDYENVSEYVSCSYQARQGTRGTGGVRGDEDPLAGCIRRAR